MPDDTEKEAPKAEEKTEEKVEAKPKPEEPAEAAAAEEGADEEEEEEEEGDAYRPEAIAKRIEAIGGETELERIAREEEQKLLERKRAQKKKGKRGLEAAASKKLAKIGERVVKRPTTAAAVDAVPEADPLIERAARVGAWARKNAAAVRAGVALILVALAATGGYTWYQQKKEAKASAILAEAVADERGRVSATPDKDDDDSDDTSERITVKDPRPVFKSADAQRDSALAKYRDVESKYPNSGAAILARLGEASLLLDKKDADGAIKAYSDVRGSALAAADAEVKGRAIEGLGFAYELKAQAGDKDANLDQAAKAFKELQNVDAKGFKELGMYHEARVAETKGDKQRAIDLLKQVREETTKAGESRPFPFLEFVVQDRLHALDPSAAPARAATPPSFGPGGNIDMNDPEVMRKIQEMLKKQGGPKP